MTNPIPVYYVVRYSGVETPKVVTHALPMSDAEEQMNKLEAADQQGSYFLVEALKPMVVGR